MRKYRKGLHLLAEAHTKETEKLVNINEFKLFILNIIEENNLTCVGETIYKFDEGGFTSVFCLSESHMAFHTWPEFNFITFDIFLCNYSRNNDKRCKKIYEEICSYFNSYDSNLKTFRR